MHISLSQDLFNFLLLTFTTATIQIHFLKDIIIIIDVSEIRKAH